MNDLRTRLVPTAALLLVAGIAGSQGAAVTVPPPDPSPHQVRFVEVERGVKLEVLDWGGSGLPIIFLAGGGDTAHVFDELATRFAGRHRVVGITRRGFGQSDKPPPVTENYAADRLGDDVLTVMRVLEMEKPVLVGHSFAGVELSSIGSRHPERVAGLVYLDAHGATAYYDSAVGNYGVELAVLLRKMGELSSPDPSVDKARIGELLQSDLLKRFESSARWVLGTLEGVPSVPGDAESRSKDAAAPYRDAMNRGVRMFTSINAPILALAALPHDYARTPDPALAATIEMNTAYETRQTDAFEKGLPAARVVRIPYASHYIFRSHEAEVVTEMSAFIESLH